MYHQKINLFMCVWEVTYMGASMHYVQTILLINHHQLRATEDIGQHQIEVKNKI